MKRIVKLAWKVKKKKQEKVEYEYCACGKRLLTEEEWRLKICSECK